LDFVSDDVRAYSQAVFETISNHAGILTTHNSAVIGYHSPETGTFISTKSTIKESTEMDPNNNPEKKKIFESN
jgi:hypothetical protein